MQQWIKDLHEKAEQGDSVSQLSLSEEYVTGKYVPKNYSIAAQWFVKSWEEDYELAMEMLSDDSEYGYELFFLGVEEDDLKAFRDEARKAIEDAKKAGKKELNLSDIALEDINTLLKAEKWDEAIEACKQEISNGNDVAGVRYILATAYKGKEDFENALIQCEEAADRVNGNDKQICELRAEIYEQKGDYENARREYVSARSLTEDRTESRELQKAIEKVDNLYIQSFDQIPYQKRKLILPVEEIGDLSQRKLQVFDVHRMPSHIAFPVGHPVSNQLYVGHPYVTSKYIPFDNYDLELAEDKVREFCHLMQCMGATEITIESIRGSSKDEQSKHSASGRSHTNVNVGAKKAFIAEGSVEVDTKRGYSGESESSLLDSLQQRLALEQRYQPTALPYVPADLVWYHHEPSWQRLVQQRMQGSLLEHREKMETSKNRAVQQNEVSQIQNELNVAVNASFKLLSGSVKVGTSSEENKASEIRLELKENVELTIYVRFAPLASLQGGTVVEIDTAEAVSLPCAETYSEAEKEYMEDLQHCLEEGSEVSEKERRMLNRLRDRLGISEARAMEIENSLLVPPFDENEMEYVEELKHCFEEDSEVSEKEKRMLSRLRDKLGISEERAGEIELRVIGRRL